MKTNDIITAAQLIDLIAVHGTHTVSFDGGIPEPYTIGDEIGLEGGETFRVVINYGHEVQFHLVSDDMRAIITTGLKGRCENMEWVA
ncbi:hypothetical protein V0M98_33855 (plasmid) [Pseudomonas silesiensis]|uniref:hypothetical protein n=1 Tax=Pseudomonas silesiensis TaxID=1853130 RepID=UPI0030D16120